MSIFDAVIQGIVQGLTEFLPVSSSGHLLISQHILGVRENNLFFNVMLHIGTLLAVLAVYWKKIFELICAFFRIISKTLKGKFKFKNMDFNEQMVVAIVIGLIPLFLFFMPVPGTGMNVKDIAAGLSSEKNIMIVGMALVLTSFLIYKGINVKKYVTFSGLEYDKISNKGAFEGKERVGLMDALWIGVMQFIAAIFPGISRSGSTLSVGLLRGVSKKTALDYSFILGIPAIVAAALLEFKEVFESNAVSSIDVTPVVVGMIVSAVVGFLSIKLFKWLLSTDKMMIFVIYTFVVGIAAILIGVIERFKGINIFTGFSV